MFKGFNDKAISYIYGQRMELVRIFFQKVFIPLK